jgi:hypothetical protein
MSERGGGEGSSSSPGKKARKPYTITRPRERWSPEEHERFLDALLRSVHCTRQVPFVDEFPLLCSALFSTLPLNLRCTSRAISQVRPRLEEDRGARPHQDRGAGNPSSVSIKMPRWLPLF